MTSENRQGGTLLPANRRAGYEDEDGRICGEGGVSRGSGGFLAHPPAWREASCRQRDSIRSMNLYDTAGYMEAKLRRIREIIRETGLKRERIPGGFFWNWKKYPGPQWEISWEGFEAG